MNFLFTIDENYIEPIKVLLFSIYDNMGSNQRFYFIYQNISLDKRKQILEFVEKKCKSKAFFVEYNYYKLNSLPVLGSWSVEIYFRLFAPYMINDVDKILYLDGDTIVNGNLEELFQMKDFDDYAIAAVANDVQSSHKLRLGLEEKYTYINSGVLLMNFKKIRNLFSEEEIFNKLLELKDCLNFPDQDFINIVFKDNIKVLDTKYNYMINLTERVQTYPKLKEYKICHYVLCKPWYNEFPYKTDYLYFKYLIKSKQYRHTIYLFYKHRKVRMKYKLNKLVKR